MKLCVLLLIAVCVAEAFVIPTPRAPIRAKLSASSGAYVDELLDEEEPDSSSDNGAKLEQAVLSNDEEEEPDDTIEASVEEPDDEDSVEEPDDEDSMEEPLGLDNAEQSSEFIEEDEQEDEQTLADKENMRLAMGLALKEG